MLQDLNIIKNLEAPSATQMMSLWDRLEICFHRLSVANVQRDIFHFQHNENEIENIMQSRFKEICAFVGQNFNTRATKTTNDNASRRAQSASNPFVPNDVNHFHQQQHWQQQHWRQQRSTLDECVSFLLQSIL